MNLQARLLELKNRLPAGSYLVGGAVRDRLLGVPPKDLDVLVPGDPFVLGRALAEGWNGFFVPLDETRRIARVVLRGGADIDLLPIPPGGIADSLAERDFTINAIALSLDDDRILDPFNGQADIHSRSIRAVADINLDHDPLRLLRAWRFRATLGFSPVPQLVRAIQIRHNSLWSVAAERIAEEWFLLLAAKNAGRTIQEMNTADTLLALFPEFRPMRGCVQNEFHHLDVLDHSLAAVDIIDELAADPLRVFPVESADAVADYLNRPLIGGRARVAYLRFACLLHDIEKPSTRAADPDGRIHFYGHERAGAASARTICEKFKLARVESDLLMTLVGQHMIFGPGIYLPETNLDRFFYRLFRDFGGDDGLGLLILSLADRMASLGPAVTPEFNEKHKRFVFDGIRRYFQEKDRVVPPRILSGDDVMRALNMPPGPAVGAILERVRELQAEGKILSRVDALRILPSLID